MYRRKAIYEVCDNSDAQIPLFVGTMLECMAYTGWTRNQINSQMVNRRRKPKKRYNTSPEYQIYRVEKTYEDNL